MAVTNSSVAADLSSSISISQDQAADLLIDAVVPDINSSSLRINQYPTLLEPGWRVRQAVTGEGTAPQYLVSANSSWLFFIDPAPAAHFAHAVEIALVDARTGEIQRMKADWWPIIEVPVFQNSSQRQDPDTIVFER